MAIQQFKATTSDLLTSIRLRGNIPNGEDSYSDANLLTLADEELQTRLMPIILSTQEDYYVEFQDFPGTTPFFTIPDRAVGGKLRDVVVIKSNGAEVQLSRVDPSQATTLDTYWVRGNRVMFLAPPGNTIRLYYHQRPSHLCRVGDTGTVSNIGSGTNIIAVTSLPSNCSVGTKLDIVSSSAPFKHVAFNATVQDVGSGYITVDKVFTAQEAAEAAGQYICLAGQAPVVQLPYELIPILAQRVVVKVLEATGDLETMKAAKAELSEMEQRAFTLLEPRVDSQPQKVTNRYRPF